jgi:hypothetical protein
MTHRARAKEVYTETARASPGLCVNHIATLTPTLSIAEGEGGVSIPSPPEGERDRVRGRLDAERAFVNEAG